MSPAAMRLFELPADSQEILFTAKDKVAVDTSPTVIAKSVPISHQDISETKPDILSLDDGFSSEDFKNCPMLTAILQDSPRTKAMNQPKCSLCHQIFESKRLLKGHEKKCRREGSSRVVIVHANGWTCSICQATGDHLRLFKDHIFYQHNDREVQVSY
jgi:hypothetical protein